MLFACLTPPLPKGAATVPMPFPVGWFCLLWSRVQWNPTVCPGQSLALSLLQFVEVLPCCSIYGQSMLLKILFYFFNFREDETGVRTEGEADFLLAGYGQPFFFF